MVLEKGGRQAVLERLAPVVGIDLAAQIKALGEKLQRLRIAGAHVLQHPGHGKEAVIRRRVAGRRGEHRGAELMAQQPLLGGFQEHLEQNHLNDRFERIGQRLVK